VIRSTLPRQPEREDLLGFWVAVSLLVGTMAGLVPVVAGVGSVWIGVGIGLVAFGALLAVGHGRERMVDRLYGGWDRGARAYTRRARTAVTAIWYWSVIAVVARTGVRGLVLDESPWSVRETVPPQGYADQGDGSAPAPGRDASRGLVRWAVGSGRGWTVVLLPFFGILRALQIEGRRSVASDMYTLY
jgi:hypothetical protein